MNIIEKNLNEIKPYEKNPRKNDNAVEYVANSIREFGFKVPIVIDKNGVIVAGHTRYKASKKLGLEKVPCIIADDLTPEQIKAYRLADNKVSEKSEWDFDLLQDELSEILNIDMEMFDFNKLGSGEGENPYSKKINIPQYEITGEKPDILELVDDEKTNELIEEIKKSNVTKKEKDFLIQAAQRHLAFNYSKVAEYYAHASEEMQELMEKSALVIIDFKDAIANGYVQLSEELKQMYLEDSSNA